MIDHNHQIYNKYRIYFHIIDNGVMYS